MAPPVSNPPRGPMTEPSRTVSRGKSGGGKGRELCGSSEEVALCGGDDEFAEHAGGFLVFDPFGDRLLTEAAGQRHDCTDDRAVAGAGEQVAHELDVDLQIVD